VKDLPEDDVANPARVQKGSYLSSIYLFFTLLFFVCHVAAVSSVPADRKLLPFSLTMIVETKTIGMTASLLHAQ